MPPIDPPDIMMKITESLLCLDCCINSNNFVNKNSKDKWHFSYSVSEKSKGIVVDFKLDKKLTRGNEAEVIESID